MFRGKARTIVFCGEIVAYKTRKDRRFIIKGHSCNPGKKNKKMYNRALRNVKLKEKDFKNNEWKKTKVCDKWNWC